MKNFSYAKGVVLLYLALGWWERFLNYSVGAVPAYKLGINLELG